MFFNWLKNALLLGVFFLILPGLGQAGEAGAKIIPESAEGLEDGTGPGWHPLLKASANLALGQNQNVPGNPDGLNLQFGYIINSGFGYLNNTKEHEWITSLFWQLGYSKTPVVDALIKSVDTIDFKTTYLYHIPQIPWFGPFAAFRLSAPMLPAYEIRADPSDVIKLEVGEEEQLDANNNPIDDSGAVITAAHPRVQSFGSAEKIDLTGAFAPLILRESAGLFAIPLDKPYLRMDIRLGFGAWETIVRDGFVVEDNEDTADFLELRRLQDSVQAGPELGIIVKGVINTIVTYNLSILLMQPVAHNATTDLEGMDLLNAEFEAVVGVKLWKYFTLDYAFKAYKQPLVVEDWQIQNSLLLSASFDIIGAKPAPAPPEPCKCEETPPADCPPPPPATSPEAAADGQDPTAAGLSPASESSAAPEATDKEAESESPVSPQPSTEEKEPVPTEANPSSTD